MHAKPVTSACIPNQSLPARFEVPKAVLLTVQVFWDLMIFRQASSFLHFIGLWYLHFQGQAVQKQLSQGARDVCIL
jgi:hypothetical protein